MNELKDQLFNYDYWNSTQIEQYDITKYDISLCQKGMVSKQVAHNCIVADIKILDSWTNNACMQKALKTLKSSLNLCKRDPTNMYFWDVTAPNLAKQELDKLQAKDGLENSTIQYMNQASKRMIEEEATVSTSKPMLIKKLKTKAESEGRSIQKEIDGVALDGSDWSLGTLIKQKALGYHEQYKLGRPLNDGCYAVMAAGLSSIMDFCCECDGSQKALLKHDWQRLLDHYKKKYQTKAVAIPEIVSDTWTIIVNTITRNRDINPGLRYLYKIYPKYINTPYFYCFKIFEHILDLVDNYSDMLVEGNSATENDFIRVVWSSIFEQLFRPNTNVSVITGETVNPISTLNRKEQYNVKQNTTKDKEKKIIGFKIDIRLTYNKDCSKYACIDLCAGEAAKEEDKSKTILDQCKAVREAKDNLDVLLSVLPKSFKACVGWSFLLAGATCSISSLHLDANGLYINVPKFNFSLPTTLLQLPDFINSLNYLLTLRKEIFSLADLVQNQLSQAPSIMTSLGKPNPTLTFSPKVFWQRGTYYRPPGEMVSKLPKNLFGAPPPQSILQKLEILFEQNDTCLSADDYEEPDGQDADDTDENGWRREGTQWYNVYTTHYSTTSPYDCDSEDDD